MLKVKLVVKSIDEIVIFYFDLDCFKVVNDICGYKVGDILIKDIV